MNTNIDALTYEFKTTMDYIDAKQAAVREMLKWFQERGVTKITEPVYLDSYMMFENGMWFNVHRYTAVQMS